MTIKVLYMFFQRNSVKLYAIPFLLFKTCFVYSQGLCDKTGTEKGGFDFKNTNFTTVCSLPYNLQIEDISGGTNIKYVFDYQGEMDVAKLNGQLSGDFEYKKQGVYTILQYGVKNGKEMYACEKFEVWESKKPILDYYICDNKNAEVIISNTPENKFEDFFIFWGDGNEIIKDVSTNEVRLKHQFATTQTNQNISIYAYRKRKTTLGNEAYAAGCTQILGLNLNMNESLPKPKIIELKANNDKTIDIKIEHNKQIASFQITEQLPLGEALVGSTNTKDFKVNNVDLSQQHCYKVSYEVLACNTKVNSDASVCSVPIQIQENVDENLVSFYANEIPTKIFRNDENGLNSKELIISSSLQKDEAKCGVNYCYSGLIEKNNVKIYTEQKCTNRIITPPSPLVLCVASVKQDNQIEISILDNTMYKEYQYFKQSSTGTFDKIETSSKSSYLDLGVKTNEKSYCYQVRYKNDCDNLSNPSEAFCSIFLNSNLNELDWTSQLPFTRPILNYQVDKYDEFDNVIDSRSLSPTVQSFLIPETDNNYYYKIVANSANGIVSKSNVVNIRAVNGIYIPSTFTPNSDGINDNFIILGKNITTFELLVYNKWGEPVFESNSINILWNGCWKNDASQPLPTGQYALVVRATFNNGEKIEKRESVTLLR